MPSDHDPPLVLFVAFPGMGLLDLTGPQTVFWCAAKRMAGRAIDTILVPGAPGIRAVLDGRRVATHWNMADVLEQRYPSLALVEEDCGRTVAMDVARELVVFMKRSGNLGVTPSAYRKRLAGT